MSYFSIKRTVYKILGFLYRRTILVLSSLLVVAVAIALMSMANLSDMLIEAQSLQSAKLSANALNAARTLYSANVVSRVRDLPDVAVSHDYYHLPHGIPNPATYTIELGTKLSDNTDTLVRLYSDYPFPHRENTGGPQDEFQRQAIAQLKAQPSKAFFRRDHLGDTPAFRYAEAVIMGPSCVSCHNSHPNSPRKDWRVGDVRGVLEISQPIDSLMGLALKGMRMTLVRLVLILGLGLLGLTFVIGRLRHTTRELQHKVSEQTAELRRLASLDGLTQIANRRSFDQHLQQEWQRGCHASLSLSLVLCDVDCFKQYNDTYGHQAGDTCLQAVARVIAQHSRRVGDLAARYGGEEFALLLPNTDNVGALQVAEQVRLAIQQLEIGHRSSVVGQCVSLSLGVATLIPNPTEDAESLIRTADAALYQAKRQGRNCTVSHGEEECAISVLTPLDG